MASGTRRHQAERFIRFQHQFARARRRRDHDEFKHSLDRLLTRVHSQSPPPAPVILVPTASRSDSDAASREHFDQSMRDLLVRVHGRPHDQDTPGPRRGTWWSNQPVVGYRVWELIDDELHGARTAWCEPLKKAECLSGRGRSGQPIPHDLGVCGNPPCGIYAMKGVGSIRQLVETTLERCRAPIMLAVGIVSMSGRVIEHEHGYRAERASVTALSLFEVTADGGVAVAVTADPRMISAAFSSPRQTHTALQVENLADGDAYDRGFEFLARASRAPRNQ